MPFAAVRILLPLSLALAAPVGAHAQISDEVVKIGVLTDLSGPASTPTGTGSVLAAQMAVEDFGGKVAGKPVAVVSADHQIKPDVGAAIARRWYDVEQVDLIVDVPVSAVGLAVQNVAKEKKRMLIVHSTGLPTITASSARPTPCSGCSIRVRWRLGPRRRWSSAAATPGSFSPPIMPSGTRSSSRLRK